jgi:hypothetical protein
MENAPTGWMEQRRIVQVWAMIAVFFMGLIFFAILYRRVLQSFSIQKKDSLDRVGVSDFIRYIPRHLAASVRNAPWL